MQYNRRKYQILTLILNFEVVTPEVLISNLKMTPGNAWQRLSKMYLQGYLIRNKKGHYKLSVKGLRVQKKLQELRNLERETGKEISFDLRKFRNYK